MWSITIGDHYYIDMPETDLRELVFYKRPDLTPFLIHLTKNTSSVDDYSAYDNLVSILRTGDIWGSDTEKGFIKGPNNAACFMDVPFSALKFILDKHNADPQNPRYEPYGVVVSKKYAYANGCRPVLYLSNEEHQRIGIPGDELWRVVRFEPSASGMISWIHEREWRCKGTFSLPKNPYAVLVRTPKEAAALSKSLLEEGDFKSVPQSVLPLQIMCQGLPYLNEE